MTDAATQSLEDIHDSRKYVRKSGVPLFRAHRRTLTDPKTGEQTERIVTEDDLPEIVAHMKAMEEEGRLFRLGNGHIDPTGTEQEQPELLALFRNPRLGTFGPKRIPCVLVDEYARADKLDTLRDRPYRSAEYYPKSKVITGAAALMRDPQLNLGVVLYRDGETPWFYSEPIMPEPTAAAPGADDPSTDLSPEEVAMFEKMCAYMAKKFPQLNAAPAAPAAPGPENAPPATPEKKEPAMNFDADTQPELYALQQQLADERRQREQDRAALQKLQKERDAEKVDALLERLEVIERYEFDRADIRVDLLAADAAGRERIAARIRKFHPKLPGGEPIEVYRGSVEDGGAAAEQAAHNRAMTHLRAHPGMSYDDARTATAAK